MKIDWNYIQNNPVIFLFHIKCKKKRQKWKNSQISNLKTIYKNVRFSILSKTNEHVSYLSNSNVNIIINVWKTINDYQRSKFPPKKCKWGPLSYISETFSIYVKKMQEHKKDLKFKKKHSVNLDAIESLVFKLLINKGVLIKKLISFT